MLCRLEEQVLLELKPGERLIWSGRSLNKKGNPRKGSNRLGGMIESGIAAVFVGLFVSHLFGMSFPYPSLISLPIGAAFGFSRAGKRESRAAYLLSRSVFALTNRRVFAIHDCFRKRRVKSLPLESISSVRVLTRTECRGNIGFIAQPHRGLEARTQPRPYVRFVLIGNPEFVRELIEKTLLAFRDGCE